MKKYIVLVLAAVALAAVPACQTRTPPQMSHYRKNVIVEKDLKIRVYGQNGYVDRNNLRQGLVMRMVTEKSRIMLHVHRDVPREDFDDLLAELKTAGFKDLLFRDYRD